MRLVLFAILLSLPLYCFTQESEGEGLFLQPLNEGKEVLTVPELKKPVMDRIDLGLDAGAAFTSFGRHGSIFSTYLAPEIRYQATDRVHFSTGIVLSTGFMPGAGIDRPGMAGPGIPGVTGNRFNRVLFFAEGNYRLSHRLTIGGMLAKELDNDLQQQMNAFQKNSGFQSMGISVDYRITDNVHVGARFNVTDGQPYYFTDPAIPFMRRSPFGPGW